MTDVRVGAETPQEPATSPHRQQFETQYVSFWIGRHLLGVSVDSVQEVLSEQCISRVSRSRREIAGLLNLRGQIVTAVSLRRRLGMPDRAKDAAEMNVVVRVHDEPFSLLVDEVGDVLEVSPDSLVPAPSTLEPEWRDITESVARLDDHLLIILNVPKLLAF